MKGARVFRITKTELCYCFFGGQCELFWFEIMDTIKLVVKKNCFCLYDSSYRSHDSTISLDTDLGCFTISVLWLYETKTKHLNIDMKSKI